MLRPVMRILLVYPYLPHPDVSHGSGRLLLSLLRLWREKAQITLVCGYRPHEAKHVEAARSLVHELVPVSRPLRSDLSAMGRAMESARTALLGVMRRDPIHVTKLDRVAFREAIRKARARTRFDVAQVELAGLSRCVAELSGLPAILFDHEAGVASGGDLSSDPRSLRYIQAIYPRFTLVGTLCREDAVELAAVLPRPEVVVRRPGVIASPPPRTARPPAGTTVLFFGSPDHLPNRDALEWLASSIWPAVVARTPGARCVVTGGVAAPRLARLLAAAGIENKGFVPDLDAELANAAVVVAPVRLGRGVRMKNLEALAAGRPLVTTTLGGRGLDLENGKHALVADGASDFAGAVSRLVDDGALAARIGGAARAHVTGAFTHEAAASFNLGLWKRIASQ
jgi:glycosyltransferase involved in cell wall biosynthesis